MRRFFFNIFLIILYTQTLFSQEMPDSIISEMRRSFNDTFKNDFIIISDTIKPDKDSIDHWLVTVVPKRVGFFTIRFIYKHEQGSRNDYEIQISVDKKGEKRYINLGLHYLGQTCYDICLGDTIIIPVLLSKHFICPSFSNEPRYQSSRYVDKEAISYYHQYDTNKWFISEVTNHLSELECISISSDKITHRHPDYLTIQYYAVFRAKKVGNFNLNIDKYVTIPVKILSKDESIKIVVENVSVEEKKENHGSSSRLYYYLEAPVLRVNDILIVVFMMYRGHRNNIETIIPKIELSKSDYSLLNKGYDYWLK